MPALHGLPCIPGLPHIAVLPAPVCFGDAGGRNKIISLQKAALPDPRQPLEAALTAAGENSMTCFNETRAAATALSCRCACRHTGFKFLQFLCVFALPVLLTSGCSGTAEPEAEAPAVTTAAAAGEPSDTGTTQGAFGSTAGLPHEKAESTFTTPYFTFNTPPGWQVVSVSENNMRVQAAISVQSEDLSSILTLREFQGNEHTNYLCGLEKKGMEAIGATRIKQDSPNSSNELCYLLAELDEASAGYFSAASDKNRYFVIRYRGDHEKIKTVLNSFSTTNSTLKKLINEASSTALAPAASAGTDATVETETEAGTWPTEEFPEMESAEF